MSRPDFWADPQTAKKESQKLSELKDELAPWGELTKEVDDLLELSQLAEKENDAELEKEIENKFNNLSSKFSKLEFQVLFSGKYDKNNAIISIHAGTGGVEAQDWAQMLLRMYLRFCEKKNWDTRILDETRGQEAGIKSITFSVAGRQAYGWLKSESGVHRLVRISPFDAEKMRHTSFALVEVLPELGEEAEIKIDPKDIRIDTYLSSGHGGQSVQTTYSAVRIVHLPTKITVTCQNERSQLQNKEMAMKILRAKLLQLEEARKAAEKKELRVDVLADWGNQIRSYVLQPYRMVKDHRTEFETSDTEGVLDGELQSFMEAYLKWAKSKKNG